MSGFNFDVYIPINSVKKSVSKAGTPTENGNYVVAGYASTDMEDLQGESIDQDGVNCDYLMGPNGFIDYEHDKEEVIGFPTSNTHMDERGLYVEAELFGNDPNVQKIIKLYKNLENSNSNKRLGFSIEGIVGEKDDYDSSIIRQVAITGVAVTKHPANMEATWDLVQKSILSDDPEKTWKSLKKGAMEAGTGITPEMQTDGAALRPEEFADNITNISYTLQHCHKIGNFNQFILKVADILDSSEHTIETKSAFLQLATGKSKNHVLQSMGSMKPDLKEFSHALNGNDASQEADDDDDDGD